MRKVKQFHRELEKKSSCRYERELIWTNNNIQESDEEDEIKDDNDGCRLLRTLWGPSGDSALSLPFKETGGENAHRTFV